ncbi:MAG: ABC transporter ATP-binding protein [Thaumarchaeota archaeon]|nr:ABC transporter ATP-binding protein [Nitrososphaerota archaeon]
MSNVVIEVSDLAKRYGSLNAVDGISFDVKANEIFAFLGPNGAGKTTTIEILQCLRRPTSGIAKVLGLDIANNGNGKEIRRRIGVLPQDFNGLDRLTVKENISLFASMYGRARDPDELIRLLDLEDKAKTRFDKLSGGLKQRVGIAAALVNDPDIVFLDEPTTGLDPKSRREVWQVIQSLKQEGRTVFLTTHYMEEAERLAARIAIINRGRIAAIGTTGELLEKYGGDRFLIIEDVLSEKLSRLKSQFPDLREANSDIMIRVESLKDVSQVIETLNNLGVNQGIQIRNPSIENVFLRLVGARLTEEGKLA